MGALSILRSHKGGVTFLKADRNETFFSGARKDNQIYQWDLRNYDKPLLAFQRNVTTNQRIYFDLNDCAQLATGGTDGSVRVWNIDDNLKEFSVNFCFLFNKSSIEKCVINFLLVSLTS